MVVIEREIQCGNGDDRISRVYANANGHVNIPQAS